MRRRLAAAAAAALIAGAAAAADRLTLQGARLPDAAFAPGQPFERRVETGGDEVLSAHVTLRAASSNLVLARDRDGFWAPWSGDRADLPPAAAVAEDGALVFKLFAEPPRGMSLPLTVTIAYRTPEGLKFGWFEAHAGAAP